MAWFPALPYRLVIGIVGLIYTLPVAYFRCWKVKETQNE